MNWAHAFDLWKTLGANYEGGAVDNEARIAIQMMHRIGALVTFLTLGFFAVRCLRRGSSKGIKVTAMVMIFLLIAQVTLGISTVLFIRPLEIATAHNAAAALLLLSTLTLIHRLSYRP
jgi:cytochrome c oxidase assembly protein subunit 15